jgi:hypothetical protein
LKFKQTKNNETRTDDDFNAINVLAMVATARRTPLAL